MMKKTIYFPLVSLLGLALSCDRAADPEVQPDADASVLFSLDTKALGDGDHTFRVVMNSISNNAYLSQGTYCSKLITPGASGSWLAPCRVDGSGNPLKTDGTVAESHDEADTDSKYGLRYNSFGNYSITVVSPAVIRSWFCSFP